VRCNACARENCHIKPSNAIRDAWNAGAGRSSIWASEKFRKWLPFTLQPHSCGASGLNAQLPRREIDAISTKYLKLVGLERFADRYPSQLSRGMEQRVAIARVLANNANILPMDEPFGTLDALTRARLQRELLQIWERTGMTCVFVTHSVEGAVPLADRVVVISAGPGRIESGSTSTCRTRATCLHQSSISSVAR
jgi:ABC-type nitrate/sulfonate/bicarbonate transport system ATPase subunit